MQTAPTWMEELRWTGSRCRVHFSIAFVNTSGGGEKTTTTDLLTAKQQLLILAPYLRLVTVFCSASGAFDSCNLHRVNEKSGLCFSAEVTCSEVLLLFFKCILVSIK